MTERGVSDHPEGIVRRVEMVRMRMRSWHLSPGDAGHIDVDDPASLDPEHPLYIRKDHPELPGYYARLRSDADNLAPDDVDELRRRAGRGE
jgi:hypothetical protein